MKNIEIIKYDDSYAQAVADMWNKSGSNWGGDTIVRTAKDVIDENVSMGAKEIFLAKKEEEILGFCSYGEYKEDEGASYIPLLNVRPDCIGQKIGKQLVLRCVEEACADVYPRLDLYTWQGNDKAVPLYKKCGFFWEKRDDSTHLMNFIPYVMRTEAVEEYFEIMDWYEDNHREIKVEADGLEEGQFQFYNYIWKKEDRYLRMEFERKGRGLSAIETEDYSIKARISKQKLVYEQEYEIEYTMTNKSGKPLVVSIQGEKDKNIEFSSTYEGKISDEFTWKTHFHVGAVSEEQSVWKTHPCVTSKISINNKEAVFKLGVEPKVPCKFKLEGLHENFHAGKKNQCYLTVENNFDDQVEVSLDLPSTSKVSFIEPKKTLTLQGKGKCSIPLEFMLSKNCFYSEEIAVGINGQDNYFTTTIAGEFRGYHGKYYGEAERYYGIYNGPYAITLYKEYNNVFPSKLGHVPYDDARLRPPIVGLPYSMELQKKKPVEVNCMSDEDKVSMALTFDMDFRKGLRLVWILDLYNNGIINSGVKLINAGDKDIEDIVVCQRVFQLFWNAYMAKEGKIIRTCNSDGFLPGAYDNKLDENWVFADYTIPTGVAWPEDYSVDFEYGVSMLKYSIDTLKSGETLSPEPVVIGYDSFRDYKEFREYLGYSDSLREEAYNFETEVNNGNPFIYDNPIPVKVKEHQKIVAEGNWSVADRNIGSILHKEAIPFKENKAELELNIGDYSPVHLLDLTMDTNTSKKAYTSMLLSVEEGQVETNIQEVKELKVYTVSNGVLEIKSAPDYMSGIYSMSFNGEEYLDHSFPEPSIKAWWNFWTGGMYIKPNNASFASIRKEEVEAKEVELQDHYGNCWKGIKTICTYKSHEKFKGLIIEEYFLMLPGVPLLCTFAAVNQQTGIYLEPNTLEQNVFMRRGDKREGNYYKVEGKEMTSIFKAGEAECNMVAHDLLVHGHEDSAVKAYYYLPGLNDAFNSNGATVNFNQITQGMPHGVVSTISPRFVLFSELDIRKDELKGLLNIGFDK